MKARSCRVLGAIAAMPLLAAQPGLADNTPTLYHLRDSSYGCADPTATRALANPDETRRGSPAWVNATVRNGNCVAVTPRSPWRVVSLDGDVALMAYAGDIGPPGSYYFSIVQMFAPDGGHPGDPPAQPAATAPAADAGSSPTVLAPNDHPAVQPEPPKPPGSSWSAVSVVLAVIALGLAGGLGFLLGRAKRG
jgi:hypothetical protein